MHGRESGGGDAAAAAYLRGDEKLDMQVHIATKLNRSHLLLAKHSYLLPALGRTERDLQATGIQSVTVEDSMSMVHASCGGLKPASQWLKSEPAIVAGLARATLPHSPVNWEALTGNYALIRDAIEAVIPAFRDYNARIVELWRISYGYAGFAA